ncbi:MAG: ATP-binding protein [Elusimicrobiota bacterium]|nr:ATP-binding protein [Elusimicrobiota bacterium]
MLSRRIGFKLTGAVAATALVTISVFAYVSIRSHERSLLAEVERHANQLSEAVKSGTEYDMLGNQRERIHQSITRVGNQSSIERIRVMNKSGAVIYSSDAAEIGKNVDKQAESCFLCHSAGRPLERLEIKERTRVFRLQPGGPRTLGIINPIYNAPSCWTAACHAHPRSQVVLGVLDVTLPLTAIDREIRRAQLEVVIFALSAILALSVIVAFLVKRWVDVPVADLLAATQRVAGGDLRYTIEEKSDDELGMLARSFNNMTAKLSEARLQLFQSDKLASLGRLAAGVAHEINNPLTGVLTYSSFLLKRTKAQPELQEDLKVIVRETLRSREIVKSLLDFARQSVPKKTEADVNEIVARAATVVESQLALNHVKLVLVPDRSIPKAAVDANQIQQVFINLFVNASDAIGPKGGTITVSSAALSLSPVGITQIKKAQCPKRHSLVEGEVRIDGKPSVRLKARHDGNEGFIYLNSMYGMGGHHYGIPVDDKKELALACPECSSSLIQPNRECPRCGAPVYAFESPPRGLVEGCSRKGCPWQRWEDVDATGAKEFVEVRVHDDGCGIAKEHLPKIFEPFYSTKGQTGTGLGLSVIWGIVDNHNGSIAVESEAGAGTTFVLRLPVKP